jgi:nucleotide-binding universal stress UspA family protein
VFHAVKPPGIGAASPFIPFGTDDEALEHEQRTQARDELRKLREDHLAGVDNVAIVEMPTKSVATAICEQAEQLEADLIIVGTRGLTGLSRLFIGSVAEKVVRHASCSVLTVTRDANVSDVAGQRLLVATDFSEPARGACVAADHWARQLGTRVLLFHALAWPGWTHPTGSVPAGAGVAAMGAVAPSPTYVESLLQQIRTNLEVVRRNLFPEVADVAVEVVTDAQPAAAICDRADRDDVDMVVVGTLGRTGLSRVLIGSVAERVVRHCCRPVLCVRVAGT